MRSYRNVPHTHARQDGEWALVPYPTCPWCGSENAPKNYGSGKCNNSWHRSHPEHKLFWTYPKDIMRDVEDDLWKIPCDAICITTNRVVTAQGRLVMGGGCAAEARNLYPDIDRVWGQMILNFGPGVYTYEIQQGPVLVSFPTKDHWKHPSTLEMIEDSTRKLVDLTNHRGWKRVLIPRPGCGLGGLSWENEVKPLLAPLLDGRFTVVGFPS